jgi:hypothetical protein
MAKKERPLDLEEEKAEKAQFGGMTKAQIESARSAIETQKAKSATISGDLSAKLELFEKAGGHKAAMKTAARLASMEPQAAADYWRSLNGYAKALGVFDQIDMFEQEAQTQRDAETLAIVSSAPQQGAEPVAESTH